MNRLITDQKSDFDLVREFNSGSEPAFNALVARYRDKIYWHARRMTGNHYDADDVVQEVLMVLYKKLPEFRFQSGVYTWIYRIVSTRSLNTIRKNKIKRFFSLEDSESANKDSGSDFVKQLEDREEIERLERMLQKLPAKQREVFIMRNFNELSYQEIAEITGKSEGALKANYFHALEKLTNLMKK